MALTRSFLKGMGLSAEQESAIIEAHTETVDALKLQRDEFKAGYESAADVQKQLDEANAKLAEYGTDESTWKAKFEEVSTQFETFKAEQAKAKETETKTASYLKALKAAGVSDKAIELIMDGSKAKETINLIELGDDGEIKGLEELTNAIKSDYAGFITSVEGMGATTQTPPASYGSDGKKSKEEIMQIKDATERQKAIAENPAAFGI